MNRQRRTDERLENATQALREAEARHERELADERDTRTTYLRVWLRRNGGPIYVDQDELREVAAHPSRLAFDVLEDGEWLRISETSEETI